MSCEICPLEIGKNYNLLNGSCSDCGEPCESVVGSYMGLFADGYHRFRLHPKFRCRGCGKLREFSRCPCDDMLDVTEEYTVMEHHKESHWIGGQNA